MRVNIPGMGWVDEERVAGQLFSPVSTGGEAVRAAGALSIRRAASTQPIAGESAVACSTDGNSSMIINTESLRSLFIAFNAAFKGGFDRIKPRWQDIAMKVSSSTLEEEYGWLGMFPQIREWLGDRVINSIAVHGYRIRNRDFESTISVPRNNIEDDRIGMFSSMFEELGRGAAEHPDKLVFGLLASGFSTACYDGQYFFDTDHSALDDAGQPYSVSNIQAGTGPAWYLLDTSRAVRPLVYQERRPFNMVPKDKPSDDNVFFRKEYIYGTDGRSNVGYGFWQLAYASRAELTAENYEAARAAMAAQRGDFGHPLGIVPNVLLVPIALEGAGRRILNTQLKSQTTVVSGGGGDVTVTAAGSNEWAGSAELIATPWL